MPSFFNKTSTAVILLIVIIIGGVVLYRRNRSSNIYIYLFIPKKQMNTDALLSNLSKVEPDYIRVMFNGNMEMTYLCYLDKQADIDRSQDINTVLTLPNWKINLIYKVIDASIGETTFLLYPDGLAIYKYCADDASLNSYDYKFKI